MTHRHIFQINFAIVWKICNFLKETIYCMFTFCMYILYVFLFTFYHKIIMYCHMFVSPRCSNPHVTNVTFQYSLLLAHTFDISTVPDHKFQNHEKETLNQNIESSDQKRELRILFWAHSADCKRRNQILWLDFKKSKIPSMWRPKKKSQTYNEDLHVNNLQLCMTKIVEMVEIVFAVLLLEQFVINFWNCKTGSKQIQIIRIQFYEETHMWFPKIWIIYIFMSLCSNDFMMVTYFKAFTVQEFQLLAFHTNCLVKVSLRFGCLKWQIFIKQTNSSYSVCYKGS